jgi:zinc/manganese transport system ATP-binding protein
LNAIELDQVTLSVGGRAVLTDISFVVAEGEFIGVLGPNGAGKTTLFKALLGLIPARSGTITVLGKPVRRGNPTVGYLPQVHTPAAACRLNGHEFLAAGFDGHRPGLPILSRAAAREIDRALEAVHAETLAKRPLNDMSGGERQRLLIAQALIGRPKLLLLDEPLISLDTHQQQVVVDLVRRLSREFKLTVLFSGHEINQLLSAIDRVLYLGHGHAALGTVDAVITPKVLSPLYGAPIEVLRAGGRIFVMSQGRDIEREHEHHHFDAGA